MDSYKGSLSPEEVREKVGDTFSETSKRRSVLWNCAISMSCSMCDSFGLSQRGVNDVNKIER